MQIAKESIFSGLNNLKVFNILNSQFDEYFGFTEAEVKEILDYYDFKEDFKIVSDWYDGYLIGNKRVFNPNAILDFIDGDFVPASYWNTTGSNQLLDKYLINPTLETVAFLKGISNGSFCNDELNLAINFKTLKDNFTTMVTFLFFAGYLTINNRNSDGTYNLVIPNLDLLGFYKKVITDNLKSDVDIGLMTKLIGEIEKGKTDLIENYLSSILLKFTNFDLNCEKNYQIIVMMLSLFLLKKYDVKSEQNMGLGRSDISISPKEGNDNSFIFEFKYVKEGSERSLKTLANKAIKQIKEKEYYKEMLNKKIKKVTLFGFAFSKNKVKVVSEIIESKFKVKEF